MLNQQAQQTSPTPASEIEVTPTANITITSPTPAAETTNSTIKITSAGFEPKNLTVKVGARVTWVNSSGSLTNISSATHPTHQVYPPLNLGNLPDGQSVSLVFDKSGSYTYHDHLNPNKTGVIVVE